MNDMKETIVSINDKLKKTHEDNTPFVVATEEKKVVVGDADQTEVKKNDYVISFRAPVTLFNEKPENAKEVNGFYLFNAEFKSVTITPRRNMKLVQYVMELLPFFNKLKENGEIEGRTNNEMLKVFADAGDEVFLALYNLVATFLDIDDKLGEYMLPFSVLSAFNNLAENHPELFNESENFFA